MDWKTAEEVLELSRLSMWIGTEAELEKDWNKNGN